MEMNYLYESVDDINIGDYLNLINNIIMGNISVVRVSLVYETFVYI